MFRITTPAINGSHFLVEWDQEQEAGKIIFDEDVSSKEEVIEVAIDKDDFEVVCEMIGCTNYHLETFSGFDFTPDSQQREEIWAYAGVGEEYEY